MVTRDTKSLAIVTIMPNNIKILPLLRNKNEQPNAYWGNDKVYNVRKDQAG